MRRVYRIRLRLSRIYVMRALAKLLCAHSDPQRVSKKTYSKTQLTGQLRFSGVTCCKEVDGERRRVIYGENMVKTSIAMADFACDYARVEREDFRKVK